jgi:hypothetical protein
MTFVNNEASMKILFIMMHPGYIRNYESVIRGLCDRGHQVHLRFNLPHKQAEDRLAEKISANCPGVIYHPEQLPKRRDLWKHFARLIRGGMDYLLYFHPDYQGAIKLRERVELKWEARAWKLFFRVAFSIFGSRCRPWLWKGLSTIENHIPPQRELVDLISKDKPDLLLVTPLVNFASDQTDSFRAASFLGIRSILCVASWDNLTNKGVVKGNPDRLFVWNDFQKEEAARYHFVDSSKVVVTGAQCYDKWFSHRPSSSLESFCQKVNLPPSPYLLYLCSSPFIAPREVRFVRRWVESLRGHSDERLSRIPILVRPHPQNAAQWHDVDFSDLKDVSIYPRAGANPVTDTSRGEFFDSIYHSHAVVGVNTSTMIESGILQKPVFSILDPDFSGTQEGTLHFHHLVSGGLLTIGNSLSDHVNQLLTRLQDVDPEAVSRSGAFIRSFVRPRGIDLSATPIFIEEIESFCKNTAAVGRDASVGEGRHSPWSYVHLPAAFFLSISYRLRKAFKTGRADSVFARVKKKISGFFEKILGGVSEMMDVVVSWVVSPSIKRRFRSFLIKRYGDRLGVTPEGLALPYRKQWARIKKSSGPIIFGPWVSEIGFELLYWIPFLRWFSEQHSIDPRRVIVVSRGGAELWYAGLGKRYVDVFSLFSQHEYVSLNQERIKETGTQKHNSIESIDKQILSRVCDHLKIVNPQILHPSSMYGLFKSYWNKRSSSSLVEEFTRYKPLVPPVALGDGLDLPENYSVVKFYFSAAFPDTVENRSFVRELIQRLRRQGPVVTLETGLVVDDHRDCEMDGAHGVIRVDDRITLRNNLDIQTRVISRAKAFYGTYGGFSYLAPFLGVPSVAFYSREDKFLPVHLFMAYRVSRWLRYGRFDKVKGSNPELSRSMKRPDFIAINTEHLDLYSNLPLTEGGILHDLDPR